MIVVNLETPKAGAKFELFFNKPASGYCLTDFTAPTYPTVFTFLTNLTFVTNLAYLS